MTITDPTATTTPTLSDAAELAAEALKRNIDRDPAPETFLDTEDLAAMTTTGPARRSLGHGPDDFEWEWDGGHSHVPVAWLP